MRKRLRSHEGANAVEFALVLPILVMLVFGAITFGIAFNAKQQINHATREASRFAATLAVPGGASADYETWFEDVVDRLIITSAGQLSVANPSLVVCVSVEDDFGVTRLDASGDSSYNDAGDLVSGGTITASASNPAHCHTSATSGHQVQLEVTRTARLDAVFFRQVLDLKAHAVARFEKGEV